MLITGGRTGGGKSTYRLGSGGAKETSRLEQRGFNQFFSRRRARLSLSRDVETTWREKRGGYGFVDIFGGEKRKGKGELKRDCRRRVSGGDIERNNNL